MLWPPLLPSGFGMTSIAGDEFAGPGVNTPIWPDEFDSDQVFLALNMSDESMELFDTDRPDLVIPKTNNVLVIAQQTRSQPVQETP